MKKKSLLQNVLGLIALLFIYTACSENTNDSDYRSSPPRFSNITFNGENKTFVYAGDSIVATATQMERGHLLDRTTYSWSVTPTVGELKYNTSVIYDANSADPVCKFKAPATPGVYSISFSGAYNVSGQSVSGGYKEEMNGATMVYTSAVWKCTAIVTKTFQVIARP